MGTPTSEINDLFMMTITDYRLASLYEASVEDFETYLEAWLIFSIAEFSQCNQSLEFATGEFTETLSSLNKVVLATLMMKYWMQKVVNDITQINLHITDRDFKVMSEAQNLREKSAHLNNIKEQCSQMLLDYAYRNMDWTNWLAQDFTG